MTPEEQQPVFVVSPEQLVQIIGQQYVEILFLRQRLAASEQKVAELTPKGE